MFGLMDVLMFHPSSDQFWYVLYWLVKTYCWTFATTLCRFIIQWSFVTSAFFDFVTIHHPSQWWKNTQQNGMSRPSIIDPSYSITMKSPKNHHEKITMKPPGMKPAWKNHLLDHPMKPAFFPSPMIQWSQSQWSQVTWLRSPGFHLIRLCTRDLWFHVVGGYGGAVLQVPGGRCLGRSS